MPAPEELSRDQLIALVRRQDAQIAGMAARTAELVEVNEELAAKPARLEHLPSRNSGNSSSPPSRDEDAGRAAPPEKQRRRGGPKRRRGKQPGAPGANLAWSDTPTSAPTGSPRAPATAATTWPTRRTWGSPTATSSTRSRR